jgi:hypothetical protein
MSAVSVTTTLTSRDVLRVSFMRLVFQRVGLTLIGAGPVLAVVGVVTGSGSLTRLGLTATWLVVLVPAFGALSASFTAFRPGAAGVYEPAVWTFGEEGARITQPGRDARADWTEFRNWSSIAGCLLLYTARSHYVIIPWRDVPAGEVETLQALLGEHIGDRRR